MVKNILNRFCKNQTGASVYWELLIIGNHNAFYIQSFVYNQNNVIISMTQISYDYVSEHHGIAKVAVIMSRIVMHLLSECVATN